jgi:hypothetical protein
VEKTKETGRSRFVAIGSQAAFATGSDTERWRGAQGAYLARWKGFAERWSKHRLQDLQSTIELAVRPCSSLDPRELAEMQQKWMAGIIDRYILDTIAFLENATSLPLGGVVAPPSAPSRLALDVAAASRDRVKRHEHEVA